MPEYYINDIHMHIIPGVDDGSYTLEMSKILLKLARLQGVRAAFATPHSYAFTSHRDLVQRNFQMLRAEAAGIVQLFPGCEVRCEPGSIRKTLELLKAGVLPSMNGTRYVLTEFSTAVQTDAAQMLVKFLLADGWIPVIAHAERYPALFKCDGIDRVIELGCLLQVNAYSLDDAADEDMIARARKLLAEEKVSFLGSDTHRLDFRPPSVQKGLQYVYAHCEKPYADAIAFGNAEKRFSLPKNGVKQRIGDDSL